MPSFVWVQVTGIEAGPPSGGSYRIDARTPHPCQLCWPDGPRWCITPSVSVLIAQRSVWVRLLWISGFSRVSPRAAEGCEEPVQLEAGGIPNRAPVGLWRGGVSEASERDETCRLCRPTRLGAQRRDRSEAEGPQDRVARFPYALSLPCRHPRCSTAGALAEAWNIRGNVPYPFDPYPSPFSAKRGYGLGRFTWSLHHLRVPHISRPWHSRTPPLLHRLVRHDRAGGTGLLLSVRSTGSSSRGTVVATGCRRRFSHRAARRFTPPRPRRVRLWITLGSRCCIDVAPAPSHRVTGRVLLCCITGAPEPVWLTLGSAGGTCFLSRPRDDRRQGQTTCFFVDAPERDRPVIHDGSDLERHTAPTSSIGDTVVGLPGVGSCSTAYGADIAPLSPTCRAARTGARTRSLFAGVCYPSRTFPPPFLRAAHRIGDAPCIDIAPAVRQHCDRLSPRRLRHRLSARRRVFSTLFHPGFCGLITDPGWPCCVSSVPIYDSPETRQRPG